ncbi:MAG TPA: methyltransferase domain-containing protein, partial [Anaeromyxobacteraceae bacterium]|nr:methyltransferase domain-containing protein [Anaeromyxobacteraceae bacterium]
RHGNPGDLDAYVARLTDPDRDAWQRPEEVVAALGVEVGQTVADIGAGPGYFTLRLARAVGTHGRVFAVEVVVDLIRRLWRRIDEAGLGNVTPVLARDADSLLPPASCDRILVVDTFHHFPDGVAYLQRLAGALKPGGILANVDFHRRETPVGPPLEHRVAREDFLAAADRAGLAVVGEQDFLPYQYFVLMRPR